MESDAQNLSRGIIPTGRSLPIRAKSIAILGQDRRFATSDSRFLLCENSLIAITKDLLSTLMGQASPKADLYGVGKSLFSPGNLPTRASRSPSSRSSS